MFKLQRQIFNIVMCDICFHIIIIIIITVAFILFYVVS
jgi:hypothetical protein